MEVNEKKQQEKLSELYEGREELLGKGIKIGPMKIIKIRNILQRDKKALSYYIREIGKGRTADQITLEELKSAGAKERTIISLSQL